jgi:hypothetical protein
VRPCPPRRIRQRHAGGRRRPRGQRPAEADRQGRPAGEVEAAGGQRQQTGADRLAPQDQQVALGGVEVGDAVGGGEAAVEPAAALQDEAVRPRPARQRIGPGAAEQRIRPGAADQRIRPGAADQRIRPGQALQRVVSCAADQAVVARAADQPIIPASREEGEVLHPRHQGAGDLADQPRRQHVEADGRRAGRAVDHRPVIARPAIERVVPRAADQRIVAAEAGEAVAPVRPLQQVGARGAGERGHGPPRRPAADRRGR